MWRVHLYYSYTYLPCPANTCQDNYVPVCCHLYLKYCKLSIWLWLIFTETSILFQNSTHLPPTHSDFIKHQSCRGCPNNLEGVERNQLKDMMYETRWSWGQCDMWFQSIFVRFSKAFTVEKIVLTNNNNNNWSFIISVIKIYRNLLFSGLKFQFSICCNFSFSQPQLNSKVFVYKE